MLYHTLLTALRSIKRNRKSFLINLVGLGSGLTCTILIFLWVNDEWNMDKIHSPEVFQVMEHQDYSGSIMTTRSTPGILAEELQKEVPEIEYAATLTWIDTQVLTVREDQNFRADGWHVGKDFFNVLDFKLLGGSPDEVLKDKSNIVISDELAIKLFGSTDAALGQKVQVQHDKTYLVSGVFEKPTNKSSYQFDHLRSLDDWLDENDWAKQWGNNGPATIARISKGADYQFISDKIASFIKERQEGSHVTLFLYPFADLYLYGSFKNGKQNGGRIEYVRLFSIIAIVILLIACINFMNLSTARATKRAKEIGVRKAIGANRQNLFWQYIGESYFISVLSLAIALLVVFLFLPVFNEITNKEISFQLSAPLVLGSLLITAFTGLFAGSYPAFYLSHFQPAMVLKGELRSTWGEVFARKGLVIFQFTLAIIMIVAVMVIYKQIEFAQNKNLGYNKDNLVYFYTEGKLDEKIDLFLEQVRDIPGVEAASSIGHNLLGRQNNTGGLNWPGKEPETRILFENVRVNYGMLELLGVEMKEGRMFSKEFGADSSKIIFNETAIQAMGLKEPVIGQNIKLWDEYDMEIIGVVKDFHFQSLHRSIEPLFFHLSPQNTWVVMLRIDPNQFKTTLDDIRTFYEEYNAGFTFNPQFMDKDYSELYAAEERVSKLSKYFAGFAIMISCLGLLGLASFTAERKVKEIGIRKVLGASIRNIIMLLTKDFSKLVFISITLAIPLAWYYINQWLDGFEYRIDISIWYYISAGLIAMIVAWITVAVQSLSAARTNPSKSLRTE